MHVRVPSEISQETSVIFTQLLYYLAAVGGLLSTPVVKSFQPRPPGSRDMIEARDAQTRTEEPVIHSIIATLKLMSDLHEPQQHPCGLKHTWLS